MRRAIFFWGSIAFVAGVAACSIWQLIKIAYEPVKHAIWQDSGTALRVSPEQFQSQPTATDWQAAIQAAIDRAADMGGGVVQLAAREYGISGQLVARPGVVIVGEGMNLSQISALEDGFTLIVGGRPSAPLPGSFELRDLGLCGFAEQNTISVSNAPRAVRVVCDDQSSLRFTRVRCEWTRGMGLTGSAGITEVVDCVVQYTMRDAINLTGGRDVRVRGNVISHSGDDAIAVHTRNVEMAIPVTGGIEITGNVVSMAYGIKCLGASRAIISGNRLDRVKSYGVHVGVTGDSENAEGVASMQDIRISDNIITNITNEFSNSGNRFGIWIEGTARTGSVTHNPTQSIPGELESSSGAWTAPEGLDRLTGHEAPVAAMTRVIVEGNLVSQTLPASNAYSELGFGRAFGTAGWTDAPVRFIREGTGLRLEGAMNNVIMRDNIFYGWRNGIESTSRWGAHPKVRAIEISTNRFLRCTTGVSLAQESIFAHLQSILIDGNWYDLDPYLEMPNRRSDGSWDDLVSFQGAAHNLVRVGGWVIRNCTYRNTAKPIHSDAPDSLVQIAPTYFAQIEGDLPIKGCGAIPSLETGGVLVQEVSDPNSADYGQQIKIETFPVR